MSSRHTGAFVYTGAGKKQSEDADICVRMCKKIACELQYCMARNNHQQSRCENFITSWNDCCTAVKADQLNYNQKLAEETKGGSQ